MKIFLQKSVKLLLLLEILMSKKVLNLHLKLSSIVKETLKWFVHGFSKFIGISSSIFFFKKAEKFFINLLEDHQG
jgi:hypothetical protein